MRNATLSVNLAALRANYQLIRSRHAKNSIGAVVKANAYGLGMVEISKALASEGCREFFVATLDEAIELRGALPDVRIAAFNGMFGGEEKEYSHHRITPVINTYEQALGIADWGRTILHVDTGMTRLGLNESEAKQLTSLIPNALPVLLMSHLACAGDPEHPKNAEQLSRLNEARKHFPGVPVSFANSSAHFLPDDYHFDLGRPGCALYGINPVNGENPMRHVATLSAPIIQIRTLDRDETIGYSATRSASKDARLAVVGMGYSDGYFRSLSNIGFAYLGGYRIPIMGRISMDMITLDVSLVPDTILSSHRQVEFINEQQPLDSLARATDTIGYEILTRIGRRVKRVYT